MALPSLTELCIDGHSFSIDEVIQFPDKLLSLLKFCFSLFIKNDDESSVFFYVSANDTDANKLMNDLLKRLENKWQVTHSGTVIYDKVYIELERKTEPANLKE